MRKLFSLCLVACGLLLTSPSEARADVTLFEQMILMEAAYEPLMGRVAVAGVALDRVTDPRWPSSLHGVLTQRHQFSGLWVRPQIQFKLTQVIGARIALAMAEDGTRPCGPGVLWYHADYITAPLWTRKLEVACHIGRHIFYKEPT
jgi:spore germination cell wall hydrolase CwlJ-like protein